MSYSNDLAVLLDQQADNLQVKYRPESKLDKHKEAKYYRVYTDTTGQDVIEVSQALSKPLYTREMKTAIMKRWLEINSQENPFEPEFNIGVYLSKAEQYSTLFHLIELGDKNAEKYYSIINKKIIENTDLFDWLHMEFKGPHFSNERRRYLSFKYLVDKLTDNFTKPEEGDLKGLNYILLEQARNTIVYDEKKKLVEEFFEAFREFTGDPLHFDYVKDLDYFFLVFESLLSIETAEEEEEEAGGEAATGEAADAVEAGGGAGPGGAEAGPGGAGPGGAEAGPGGEAGGGAGPGGAGPEGAEEAAEEAAAGPGGAEAEA